MINEIFPHFFNNAFESKPEAKGDDFILCYKEDLILLKYSGEELEIPVYNDIDDIARVNPRYLFCLDSSNCFLLNDVPTDSGNLVYKDIWTLRGLSRKEQSWIGAVGYQIMIWYENNKFCGKCGSETELKDNERAIICPVCQRIIYPQISPAIIVAITCKDKILLARGKHYRGTFYALIAGYADIGESLEETVVREVKEEVGLDVKNIQYFKSQPWPFSGSMMIGYFAEADDTQALKIDENEIEEAAWFTRGNLPPHASTISISGDLIEFFEKGKD